MNEVDDKKERDAKERARQRLKKLVYAGLVTGGITGLCGVANGMQLHGNASSHGSADLSWNMNDFVVKKADTSKVDDNKLHEQKKDPKTM
jgi:hypothetical protein